jgi:hypothetical protein
VAMHLVFLPFSDVLISVIKRKCTKAVMENT